MARQQTKTRWEAWQAEKQASYEADQHALAAGEKSREQLARENGVSERLAKAPIPADELYKF